MQFLKVEADDLGASAATILVANLFAIEQCLHGLDDHWLLSTLLLLTRRHGRHGPQSVEGPRSWIRPAILFVQCGRHGGTHGSTRTRLLLESYDQVVTVTILPRV